MIDTAAATPSLLTCAYVDVLWRVAEAFANTERVPRALDAYAYILANCSDPAERLATMQKAIDVLPEAEIAPLLVYERDGEFAPVMDTMLRRRVGLTAENPDLTSSLEDLARIEALAADEGNTADALLLGWYYYRHKEAGTGPLDWFDKARKRDPAERQGGGGLYAGADRARPLRRRRDGESWTGTRSPEDNLAAYLIAAIGLPPTRRSRSPSRCCSAWPTIVRVKSLQGGEQLGWYAYNLGQGEDRGAGSRPCAGGIRTYEPAAHGLAVAALGAWADQGGVNSIIREWGDRSERIANIGKPVRAELRGSRAVVDVVVDEVKYTRPRAIDPPAYAETEVMTEVDRLTQSARSRS